MEISTKVLWVGTIIGLLVSLFITVRHLVTGHHEAYDNWLLPVFMAVALQLWNGD
jgi:hypothetical protein